MARRIEYFLSTASPWAYLGHGELQRIAARHDAEILCRPMPVRRLFDETGGLPLPKRHPVRQAYRLVELQRWREIRGLALDLKPAHPLADSALGDRAVIAAVQSGHDPLPFAGAVMAGLWADRLDLSQEATLVRLADEAGLPGEDILRAAASDAVAESYEVSLADAMAAGIFGAPSYVLDGEVFWGQDRLVLLDEALDSGRAAYRLG
jgi:2-hydroxychromene-2-carboxylate isomerase